MNSHFTDSSEFLAFLHPSEISKTRRIPDRALCSRARSDDPRISGKLEVRKYRYCLKSILPTAPYPLGEALTTTCDRCAPPLSDGFEPNQASDSRTMSAP